MSRNRNSKPANASTSGTRTANEHNVSDAHLDEVFGSDLRKDIGTQSVSSDASSTASAITFDSKFLPAFIDLNREWIEKYFVMEPMDLAQLQDPHTHILDRGGEIFFIIEDDRAVGTCAMVPHGHKIYELAKMAVAPGCQGKGYGDLLMTTAIDWAKLNGATKISILSNTVLEPAITLYKKHGFQTIHLGKHPDYDRCNIEMELLLV